MKKWIKRTIAIVLTTAMAMTVTTPAFASTERTVADEQIAIFMEDETSFISALNEVASKEADITTFGRDNRTEIREIQLDNGISIVNTRTYSTREMTRVVEDEYGLFFGGTAGGAGTLHAEYHYVYDTIDNPNQMKTRFISADGDAYNLSTTGIYSVVDITGYWDVAASYNPEAYVEFELKKMATLPITTYTHTCTFDKYGSASMSWS